MILTNSKNDVIEIRPMTEHDISAIAALYREVAVTGENYKEKLFPGHENFSKHGGMFIIKHQSELKELIKSKDEILTVGVYNGAVCGFLWFGKWEKELFSPLCLKPAASIGEDYIETHGKDGLLCYAKEIIAGKSAPGKAMALSLFLNMMIYLSRHSVGLVTGEVYRITGVRDKTGEYKTDMLNIPSFNLLCASGGENIGTAPEKTASPEPEIFSVKIEPQVFLWKTEKSAEKITTLLEEKDWRGQKDE